MSSAAAWHAAKRALRQRMKAVLEQIPRYEIEQQSASVVEHVLRLSCYERACTVSVYLSMPSGEVDTWELCRHVLRQGKRLYIPRFSNVQHGAVSARAAHEFSTDMSMLRIMDLEELEHGLTYNKWGIAEPSLMLADGTQREDALDPTTGGSGLDLIILPGVAFDLHGGRLGHGKGYYDRYLDRTKKQQPQSPPATVALALREQIVGTVPHDAADQLCDTLVTPDGAF